MAESPDCQAGLCPQHMNSASTSLTEHLLCAGQGRELRMIKVNLGLANHCPISAMDDKQ